VFNTACNSAFITLIVSKWQPFKQENREKSQSQVRGVGYDSHLVFVQKFPGEKGNKMVHYCGATATSFVAKVRGKVIAHFHIVTVKRHSSMRNWLFGLPGRILCEQSP
jgi:hypothetical protein